MPQYKVLYFDGKGRAELMRLVLATKEVKYEDIRFGEKLPFAEMKPKLPFGMAPVLEVDGKKHGSSQACVRYLAKKLDLHGSTDEECFKVDMITECITEDVCFLLMQSMMTKIDEQRNNVYAQIDRKFPGIFTGLNNMVDGPYFLGDKLTVADLALYQYSEDLRKAEKYKALSDYPNLLKICENVSEVPSVKSYIASRKPTPF